MEPTLDSEKEPGKSHGETHPSSRSEGRPSRNAIDQLRRRADEIRATADAMQGEQAKARMRKIAAEYEAMALRFEKRLDQGTRGAH